MEPNVAHHERLTALTRAYQARKWRYHFLPVEVGDLKQDPEEGDGNDMGTNDMVHDESHVIRLAHCIADKVHPRRLPDRVYGG